MPSFSSENMSKLQSLKQGLNKPSLRTPEQAKQKREALELTLADHPDITSKEAFYKTQDGLIDKNDAIKMREKGGNFEYTKFVGMRKETRKDVICSIKKKPR